MSRDDDDNTDIFSLADNNKAGTFSLDDENTAIFSPDNPSIIADVTLAPGCRAAEATCGSSIRTATPGDAMASCFADAIQPAALTELS